MADLEENLKGKKKEEDKRSFLQKLFSTKARPKIKKRRDQEEELRKLLAE